LRQLKEDEAVLQRIISCEGENQSSEEDRSFCPVVFAGCRQDPTRVLLARSEFSARRYVAGSLQLR
jgi:hypothetical protein